MERDKIRRCAPLQYLLPLLTLCFPIFKARDCLSQGIGSGTGIREKPDCTLELLDIDVWAKERVVISVKGITTLQAGDKEQENASVNVTNKSSNETIVSVFMESVLFIRLNCSAEYPLEFGMDIPLPFAGLKLRYGKYFGAGGRDNVLHWVSATIPERRVSTQDMGEYNGVYSLFSRTEPSDGIKVRLEVEVSDKAVSSSGSRNVSEEDIDLEILEDGFVCKLSDSSEQKYIPDVYLVNIGGDSPSETQLFRPCLDELSRCGNKYVGINCGSAQSCKKILSPFHLHGAVRCSIDGISKDIEYFTDINFDQQIVTHQMWDDELVIRIEKEDNLNKTEAVSPTDQQNLTLYDQGTYKFECHFLPYFLVPPVSWSMDLPNESRSVLVDYGGATTDETKTYEKEALPIRSSHIKIKAFLGIQSISCQAYYWNSTADAQNIRHVVVQESQKLEFKTTMEKVSISTDEELTLTCKVDAGIPEPSYSWKKDGKTVRPNEYNPKTGTYHNGKINVSDSGTYTCTAKNVVGKAQKTFDVEVYKSNSTLLAIVLSCVCIGIIIILTGVLFLLYRKNLQQASRLTELEIKEFLEGNKKELRKENSYAHDIIQFLPYNKNYELPFRDFELGKTELGKGVHGIVYRGSMGELPVAVKTVPQDVDKAVLKTLLSELKIMIHLGKSENVVELKGACTEFLQQGRAYVLVEFCPLGNMESFLRKNRDCFESNFHSIDYMNPNRNRSSTTIIRQFTRHDLLNWSIQIARGMQHLQSKRVIHGDLAIRNVLLHSMDQIKITDFGLSRQLLNTDTYVKTHQEQLPWRSLALESLRDNSFSSKSDVWGYGVTLWEIFTLGATPYPGMSWTVDFVQHLEDNLRLSKPKYATDAIYKILCDCWLCEPASRPDFLCLEKRLLEEVVEKYV